MKTTPSMYFAHFVEPNYEDLCERPDDVRRGFNAAVSAFHMSDVFLEYYAKHNRPRVADYLDGRKPDAARRFFLKSLSAREPKFITVQTAATVYKHLYAAAPFLDGSSPGAFAGVRGRGVTIEAEWLSDDNKGFIAIKRRSGEVVSLNDALAAVVENLWPALLGDDRYDL